MASLVAPKSDLINAEFSYGRWNGDDAKSLEEPVRILVARMSMFLVHRYDV